MLIAKPHGMMGVCQRHFSASLGRQGGGQGRLAGRQAFHDEVLANLPFRYLLTIVQVFYILKTKRLVINRAGRGG